MRSYLAVYNYGQGGIWLLLEGSSFAEAKAAFPQLTVFETRPEWMSAADEAAYRERCEKHGFRWNVHSTPTGWLKELLEQDSA